MSDRRNLLRIALGIVLAGIISIPASTAFAKNQPPLVIDDAEHRASDPVTVVVVNKVSFSEDRSPVRGAVLQIVEESSGTVITEFTTDGGPVTINRDMRYHGERVNINLNTRYILREKSAPSGYEKAPDVVFEITGIYDSSITIYSPGVDSEGYTHSYSDGQHTITLLDTNTALPIYVDETEYQYTPTQVVRNNTESKQDETSATAQTNPLSTLAQTGDYGYLPPIIAATAGLCILALGIRNRRHDW